ncbi:ABC transporter permease [Nakamurella antarctica]|uniref:ABC transporter permease n=1 Tax=Nakamurella antarctica TaxID=1902245 RepID=UPI0019D0FED0|nr:ABC transporter permease [Nakamurella antarctica]
MVVSFFIILASTALTYVLVAFSDNPLKDLLELRGSLRETKIAARTIALNLDTPVPGRYFLWLGDVGKCLWPWSDTCTLGLNRDGKPVLPQLQSAIGSTLRLVIVATLLALVLGVVTGVVTALRQYSVFDYTVTFVAFLCFSLPVFWVSTLLKQYIAIDLNTWLGSPTLTYGGIALLAAVAGLFWALIIGGTRRRYLTVFGAGFAATFLVIYLLLSTNFFVTPYFGVIGVAVFGLAAALGWSALFAGLDARNRPVLYSSLATVVVGVVISIAGKSLLDEANWLTVIGMLVLLMLIGVVSGRLLGGQSTKLAGRVAATTGFTVGILIVVDRLLRSYPALFAATGGRPIKTNGSETPNLNADFWTTNLDYLMYLLLPTIAIMLISFAGYTRYTRASMLDVMSQDYVRTARAKGLNNRTVIVRHAFRNALIPLATLVAFDFAGILGGAVITETVFGWSGMGKMFTTGITNVDPNPVMAFFLITGTATVLFNMLADIAYAYLDPRIRLG